MERRDGGNAEKRKHRGQKEHGGCAIFRKAASSLAPSISSSLSSPPK